MLSGEMPLLSERDLQPAASHMHATTAIIATAITLTNPVQLVHRRSHWQQRSGLQRHDGVQHSD